MHVLHISNLTIQLDWPSGKQPTPDELYSIRKGINLALYSLEGQPCVITDESELTCEVSGSDEHDDTFEDVPLINSLRASGWHREQIVIIDEDGMHHPD